MKKILLEAGFDQLDLAILDELQQNGRLSVADLARKIHLSQPAVHNRIKRLEREGIIRQYTALIDREAAGYDLMGFIRISIQPRTRENFCEAQRILNDSPEVMECYRTSGNYDLMLKVLVQDHKALDSFIQSVLMSLPGVERIDTELVLNEIKTTTALQLRRK
jgi:Lrp/AsnC family leucine-responsive transcriptional regulator